MGRRLEVAAGRLRGGAQGKLIDVAKEDMKLLGVKEEDEEE